MGLAEALTRGAAWAGRLAAVVDRLSLPVARRVADRAVVAVVAVHLAARVPAATAAPELAPAAVLTQAAPDPLAGAGAAGGPAAAAPPTGTEPPGPGAAQRAPAVAPAPTVHVVRPGDTLWAIAGRYYGDGALYPRLVEANAGRVMPTGERFTRGGVIRPGWPLEVPDPAPVACAVGPDGDLEYTVVAGDSLSRIAERYLGDRECWRGIFALNRGEARLGDGRTLSDPNLIWPGLRLRLPRSAPVAEQLAAAAAAVPAEAPPAGGGRRTRPGGPGGRCRRPTTRSAPGAPARAVAGGRHGAARRAHRGTRPRWSWCRSRRRRRRGRRAGRRGGDARVRSAADRGVRGPDPGLCGRAGRPRPLRRRPRPGPRRRGPRTGRSPRGNRPRGPRPACRRRRSGAPARRPRRRWPPPGWPRSPGPRGRCCSPGGTGGGAWTSRPPRPPGRRRPRRRRSSPTRPRPGGCEAGTPSRPSGWRRTPAASWRDGGSPASCWRSSSSATARPRSSGGGPATPDDAGDTGAALAAVAALADAFAARVGGRGRGAATPDGGVAWSLSGLKLATLLPEAPAKSAAPPLLALGQAPDGATVYADWETLGHVLVAGLPGGGAEAVLTSLVVALAAQESPRAVRVWGIGDGRSLPWLAAGPAAPRRGRPAGGRAGGVRAPGAAAGGRRAPAGRRRPRAPVAGDGRRAGAGAGGR